jgi:hypothetical protein
MLFTISEQIPAFNKDLYGQTVLDQHHLQPKGAERLQHCIKFCQCDSLMQAKLAIAASTSTLLTLTVDMQLRH